MIRWFGVAEKLNSSGGEEGGWSGGWSLIWNIILLWDWDLLYIGNRFFGTCLCLELWLRKQYCVVQALEIRTGFGNDRISNLGDIKFSRTSLCDTMISCGLTGLVICTLLIVSNGAKIFD
ncbi:Replicase polyprotein [Dirofilaria immitis]